MSQYINIYLHTSTHSLILTQYFEVKLIVNSKIKNKKNNCFNSNLKVYPLDHEIVSPVKVWLIYIGRLLSVGQWVFEWLRQPLLLCRSLRVSRPHKTWCMFKSLFGKKNLSNTLMLNPCSARALDMWFLYHSLADSTHPYCAFSGFTNTTLLFACINGRNSGFLLHKMSALRYACFISTVATSMYLAAASEAIVFTDELAVVGADLSLSGMSSKICLSPPVTIRDFVVMDLPSRSTFSLTMVDDYSTDFSCFPPVSLIKLFSVLSAVACRRSLLSVTSGYNCTWLFWCSSELQSWTSVHPHSWGLCSSDKCGIRVRYC